MKDRYAKRKCMNCDGMGYSEESSTRYEGDIALKIVENRSTCITCNGTGIETFVAKHALFKNFRFEHPWGVTFYVKSKQIVIKAEGLWGLWWKVMHPLIWKWSLYKVFEKLKIPFSVYNTDFDGTWSFGLLHYMKWGGGFFMGDNYGAKLSILGIDFSAHWEDIGRWTFCKQCAKYIPDTKDFKDKLCSDCKYPKNEIVIEATE